MQSVKNYFEKYAALSMKGDARQLAAFYAEKVTAASPGGIMAFDNNDKFLQWLEQVFQFNQQMGMQKLEVHNEKTTPIGEHFRNAVITWSTEFAKQPGKKILFDIHYILQVTDNTYKILAYISPDEQEKVMKDQGLL